jgi:hypothetical protein
VNTRFSEEVIRKAKHYVSGKRVAKSPYEGVYYVKGSAARPYAVRTDADPQTRKASWISCSCPHGANVGAGSAQCSHAVAVLFVIKDAIPLPVEEGQP